MDRKILGGLILLLLLATFVISGKIIEINPPLPGAAIPVVGGQSIVYYLKMINANLVAGPTVAVPTTTGTLGGTPVTPSPVDQTNTCAAENPATTCPVGLASKITNNIEVVDRGGAKVFKASIPSPDKSATGYIGQYFEIDLAQLIIDNSGPGFATNNFPHSKYKFSLSAISTNSRFLFFDVTKSDSKSLDCQNIFDSSTIVNSLKSTWTSVKSAGWSNLWLSYLYAGPLVFNYSQTGSTSGYADALFSRLMKVDLDSVPLTVSCTNKERPSNDTMRTADLKINVLGFDKVQKVGDPLVIYFTLDALKTEKAGEYYSSLPSSADELFK